MNKKILLITTSRADYSQSKMLIRLFKKKFFKNFYLLVTGSHLSKKDGYTFKEIKNDGINVDFKVDILHKDKRYLKNTLQIASNTFVKFEKFFSKFTPDMLVILGDRFETLPIVYSAFLNNVCIAHINGGEVTEGAIDDGVRHSITKMSYFHFVSTNTNKKRIINFGENPNRIFNFGALGVDTLLSSKFLNKDELIKDLKIFFNNKNLILTFHPETFKSVIVNKEYALLIIKTLARYKDINFFITSSNIDRGGNLINDIFKKASKKYKNFFYFRSLGEKYYFSLLNSVDGVIGNSSSGIIECPSLKKGTINMGQRQQGRANSKSIINATINSKSIENALKKLYSKKFQANLLKNKNEYEKKNTAKKIFNFLIKCKIPKNNIKKFYHG